MIEITRKEADLIAATLMIHERAAKAEIGRVYSAELKRSWEDRANQFKKMEEKFRGIAKGETIKCI